MSADSPTPRSRSSYSVPLLVAMAVFGALNHFLPAPPWVSVMLLVLAGGWLVWMGVTLFTHRRSEREYILSSIVLLMLLQTLGGRLAFPGWWFNVVFVFLILTAVWSVWFLIRNWNAKPEDF